MSTIWYTSENSSAEKPAEIDKTSSKVYNYIRKDFVEIPAQESEGEEDMFFPGFGSAHWQYQEAKIRKIEYAQFIKNNTWWYLADKRYESGIKSPAPVAVEAEPDPEANPDFVVDDNGMIFSDEGIVFNEP